MSWRDAYIDRCLPSQVPSDAYVGERVAMADQFPALARPLLRKCGSCGALVATREPCPLCGSAERQAA